MGCRVHGVAKSRTRLHDFHLGISTQSCHLQKTKQNKRAFLFPKEKMPFIAAWLLLYWLAGQGLYFFSCAPQHVGLVVKNPPANAGDIGDKCSILGSGRSPGGGHGH